jgi:hypothetical protein
MRRTGYTILGGMDIPYKEDWIYYIRRAGYTLLGGLDMPY